MDNLEQLVCHIDYFFENIPSVYDEDLDFEVYLKDGKWLITNSKTDKQFGTTNPKHILLFLTEQNADLSVLHSMIYQNVVVEGVLRKKQLRKVEKLIGKEAVEEGEESWNQFADSLMETVGKQIKKSKLSVVE